MPFSAAARRSKLAATLVLCCLGLLFASTAATVLAAGESQRRIAASKGMPSNDAAASTASVSAINDLIDSLVAPIFSIGAPSVSTDRETVRHMLDLLTVDSASAVTWDQYTTVNDLLSHMRLGEDHLRAFDTLWQTNMRAADTALAHGQADDAIWRARENVTTARWLMLMPSLEDARRGSEMLEDAAKLLGRSALQDDQPFLRTAADRLGEYAQRARMSLDTERTPSWRLGANLDETLLMTVASNHALLPAVRVASLTSVLTGSCLREREVLFGPSNKRLRSMMALGLAIRDLPRGETLAAIHRESLLRIENPRADLSVDDRDPPGLTATLSRWMIPAPVLARVQLCRTIV